MDVLATRCAGLDVHRTLIVVCTLIGDAGRRVEKLRSEFTTTARGLAAWLKQHGVTAVGLEATGVYWMPVYATLEGCAVGSTSRSPTPSTSRRCRAARP